MSALSVKALLPEYNALVRKKGLDPVDRWRGTVKDLQKRVDRLKTEFAERQTTVVAPGAYASSREAALRTGHTESGPVKMRRKEPSKEKAKKPTPRRGGNGGDHGGDDIVKLTEICEELGISDKQARAKLRRLYSNTSKNRNLPDLVDDKWVFVADDVMAIKKILKGK